jgi:hypothetical protein
MSAEQTETGLGGDAPEPSKDKLRADKQKPHSFYTLRVAPLAAFMRPYVLPDILRQLVETMSASVPGGRAQGR